MRDRSVSSGGADLTAPFLAVLRVRSGSSFRYARGGRGHFYRCLNRNGRLVLRVTGSSYHKGYAPTKAPARSAVELCAFRLPPTTTTAGG